MSLLIHFKERGMVRKSFGLLLLLCMFSACAASPTQGSDVFQKDDNEQGKKGPEEQHFQVSGTPDIVVHSDAAQLFVKQGPDSDVGVVVTKRTSGDPDDIQVTFSQSGNTITIIEEIAEEVKNNHQVTWDVEIAITTPASSQFHIDGAAAEVQISDIQGSVQLDLSAGTVRLQEVTLTGESHIRSTAGTITFDGQLASQSNTSMETTAGTISVTLPANAAVAIEKLSTIAGIIQNEFESTDIGSGDQARLSLATVAGTINIHKGA